MKERQRHRERQKDRDRRKAGERCPRLAQARGRDWWGAQGQSEARVVRGRGRWGAAQGSFGGVSRVGALPTPTGGRGGNPVWGEGPCPAAGPSAVGCTWDFLWVALSGSFCRNPDLGCLPCSSCAPPTVPRGPAIRALRPSFLSVTHNRDMQLHGCFLGKYLERVPGQKPARCPGLSQGRPGSLQQGQGLP